MNSIELKPRLALKMSFGSTKTRNNDDGKLKSSWKWRTELNWNLKMMQAICSAFSRKSSIYFSMLRFLVMKSRWSWWRNRARTPWTHVYKNGEDLSEDENKFIWNISWRWTETCVENTVACMSSCLFSDTQHKMIINSCATAKYFALFSIFSNIYFWIGFYRQRDIKKTI